MGSDEGKLPASQKGHYPRPLGGPEPSAQGDTKHQMAENSSVPIDVGYDHSKSRPGVTDAELKVGYCNRESIVSDTHSDGMKEA